MTATIRENDATTGAFWTGTDHEAQEYFDEAGRVTRPCVLFTGC